jgi:cysteinyl-tRNA synthetase
MVGAHLGESIDIHGGGTDLVFPHHENERAQSVCAHHGKKYVGYWLHNGFLSFDSEKMSKSLGNVVLVKDLLEEVPGEAIRYVLLSAHYRAPLDWNDDVLEQAKSSLDRLYGTLRSLNDVEISEGDQEAVAEGVLEALRDDLNTPKALAELFAIARQANSSQDPIEQKRLKAMLLNSGALLGLLSQPPEQWFAAGTSEVDAAEIDALIAERLVARENKDWTRADEIRDILTAKKVVLEDGANGTRWRIEN